MNCVRTRGASPKGGHSLTPSRFTPYGSGFRIFNQIILEFDQPLHRNLVLDSSGKDSEPKEETATEQDQTRKKDQHHISVEERSNAFKDERENKAQQDDPPQKTSFFSPNRRRRTASFP